MTHLESVDLAIVIISFNTREMTLAAIASAQAETRTPHEIIVLDNASTDGSAQAVAEAHPEVRLLCEVVNHGFGPAHKIALAETNAPWVLLLNPDTVVLDRAIDRLMDFARTQPQAEIWGGRTLYADGSLNPTSCFARMTLWSVFCRVAGLNGVFRRSALFNPEYYGDWPSDTVREVDIVTGCFLLIRREFWEKLGGFDDAFVMYGEEVDLCLRARALGARPMITPDATIIHHGGASQALRTDKLVRLMRAKMELIKRHFPARSRRAGLWLFRLWPFSRRIAYGLGARVKRSGTLSDQARVWAEVWARRAEWENGMQ
jgi:GT2 family glycosyltransferase